MGAAFFGYQLALYLGQFHICSGATLLGTPGWYQEGLTPQPLQGSMRYEFGDAILYTTELSLLALISLPLASTRSH